MKKKKEEGSISEKDKGLRKYRRLALLFTVIVLFLSIWSTVVTNLEWKLSDIFTEVLLLLTIFIIGMFANVENNFSLFHIRRLKITRERLTSILIGLFFPIVFILYVVVTDESFAEYIKNISLHNFITLGVLSIPVVILISLIIYLGYKVIETKNRKKSLPEYKEEIEISLDKYKISTLNLVAAISLISMWVKIGLNLDWNIQDVNTEIVILLIIMVMKILGNVYNSLPWNNCENSYGKVLKYSVGGTAIPYIVVLLYYFINQQFRYRMNLIGYKGILSLMIYILTIFFIGSLLLCYGYMELRKNSNSSKPKSIKKRNENIIISLSITCISIICLFIYIITSIIEALTTELLLQIIIILIPLAVIIYLVMYYSIRDINR